MIRPIPAIKKEIRILGLDACSEEMTVGVVSRGGLYLDGVVSFRPKPKNASREQARRIVNSAFFPELRTIMLHNPKDERASRWMERITSLPTLTISEDKPLHRRDYKAFCGNLGRLWIKTRLEPVILKKILASSWTFGKLPEPLRIAHLLAKIDLPEISG